jgi:hypothetical protein
MKDGRKVVGFVQVIRVNLSPMSVVRREAARKQCFLASWPGRKKNTIWDSLFCTDPVGNLATVESFWRRHDTLDRECRRNIAGEFFRRRGRAGRLRSDAQRTGAHRLLSRPKPVLPGTIGPCRCQSACSIRRRVVSGNYRNRPSETQTTSAAIKAQTNPPRTGGTNFDHAALYFRLDLAGQPQSSAWLAQTARLVRPKDVAPNRGRLRNLWSVLVLHENEEVYYAVV